MIEVLQSASAILFNERLGIKIVCNSISISFIEERWYCHLKCTGLEITLFEKKYYYSFYNNEFVYIYNFEIIQDFLAVVSSQKRNRSSETGSTPK